MSVELALRSVQPLAFAMDSWPEVQPSFERLRQKNINVTVNRGGDEYLVELSYKNFARRSEPLEVHCLIEDLGPYVKRPVKILFCENSGPDADFFIANSPQALRNAIRNELIASAARLLRNADAPDLATRAEQLLESPGSGA